MGEEIIFKQRECLQKPEPEGVGTDWGRCFQVGAEAQKTRELLLVALACGLVASEP